LSRRYLDISVIDHRHGDQIVAHRCTKTITDDLSPRWNEHFFIELPKDFNPYSSHDDYTLRFEVYDLDEAMEDERLGSIYLDLRQVEQLRAVAINGMGWADNFSRDYELEDEPDHHDVIAGDHKGTVETGGEVESTVAISAGE
jgi:Ca2+-dependent lipid-binding protein